MDRFPLYEGFLIDSTISFKPEKKDITCANEIHTFSDLTDESKVVKENEVRNVYPKNFHQTFLPAPNLKNILMKSRRSMNQISW